MLSQPLFLGFAVQQPFFVEFFQFDLLLPSTDQLADDLNWLLETLGNSSGHVRAAAIDILKAYLRLV